MRIETGIRNLRIEKGNSEPSEVRSYFLSPEELEKYRNLEVEKGSKSDISYAEFHAGIKK